MSFFFFFTFLPFDCSWKGPGGSRSPGDWAGALGSDVPGLVGVSYHASRSCLVDPSSQASLQERQSRRLENGRGRAVCAGRKHKRSNDYAIHVRLSVSAAEPSAQRMRERRAETNNTEETSGCSHASHT